MRVEFVGGPWDGETHDIPVKGEFIYQPHLHPNRILTYDELARGAVTVGHYKGRTRPDGSGTAKWFPDD